MLLSSILHLDLTAFAKTVGYVGLFLVIFAESGLFFGFFLPGGSLLFVTGLLASQGVFDIGLIVPLLALAAILGDNAGYWFGAKVGTRVFAREDSFFFHKRHVETTRRFYGRYGARVIFVGRFVPIVRTFAPILAGVAGMRYRTFFLYNVAGALAWGAGVALAGYFFGTVIPGIEHYITYVILGIIFLSLVPLVRDIVRPVQKGP